MTDNAEHPSEDKLTMKWRGQNIVDIDRNFLDMAGAKRKMDMITIGVKKDLDLSDTIPTDIKARLSKDIYNIQ